MLSGTLRSFASCHPAPSTINRACASVATVLAISALCNSITSVLTHGKISTAAVPRPEQDRPPRRYSSICSAYREGRTGVSRALPGCGSASLIDQPLPRPRTISPKAFPSPGLAGFPQPERQSIFRSSLSLRIGLGVFRAHRQPPKAQSGQISAYRALMKFDAEIHLDPTREIHPPPTRDTISLWVRTVLNPSRQLRHLIGCEPQFHPVTTSIAQPLNALGIVTMNLISQRLAIHSATLRCNLARRPLKHHRHGQKPPRNTTILHTTCKSAQFLSAHIFALNLNP